VRGGIIIHHLHWLARLQYDDVRRKPAPLLHQLHRLAGRRGFVRRAGGDVHDHILEHIPLPDYQILAFRGVEYIFAQPGSDAMLIVFVITVTPSTVTLPPTVPAACAVETIVKQSAARGAKNNIR